eukprot:TRINITY_DN96444_c0_g1_i1.p1 TRINITY_DN96444_c0_g1~~TRINITY_DN96444_c0_g1_i1.p1  ORF type:complete len:288 (+),score=33.89 TRINITY_DN96444_c0_g1_i1:42-866(+)
MADSPFKNRRPAPLGDPEDAQSTIPSVEANGQYQSMPVKNTFIEFQGDEQQAFMPITAPGKFVGRLAGPAVLATPAATPCHQALMIPATPSTPAKPQPQIVNLATQLIGLGGTTPPSDRVMGAPQTTAPVLPPVLQLPGGDHRSIPPPPAASPSFARMGYMPVYQAPLPQPAAVAAPAHPIVLGQLQGSYMSPAPQGGMSPPCFNPPTYCAGAVNQPTFGAAPQMPPPMHTPVVATPGSKSAPRCFPAAGMGIDGAVPAPTMPAANIPWPSTPF